MTRGFATALDPCRFDWYAATVPESEGDELARELAQSMDSSLAPGLPSRGYRYAQELRRGELCVGRIRWGGAQAWPHVETSGPPSVQMAAVLRCRHPHRVTRADACLDWDAPRAWEAISGEALAVARQQGLTKGQAGDWLDPHQRPGDGRTLYLGSKASAVRVRVYEKGRQLPAAGRPAWVRAEVQVRPGKAAKAAVSALSASELWGAARWSGELHERLTGDAVPAARVVVWQEPDHERAYQALLHQYGRTLRAKAAECGSWAALGDMLGVDLA